MKIWLSAQISLRSIEWRVQGSSLIMINFTVKRITALTITRLTNGRPRLSKHPLQMFARHFLYFMVTTGDRLQFSMKRIQM